VSTVKCLSNAPGDAGWTPAPIATAATNHESVRTPHYNFQVRKPVVLITGAGGEIGHGLIAQLAERRDRAIVTLDVSRLDATIADKVDREVTGSILDRGVLERLLAEFQVELVFHLAALLSTRSEFTPVTAHQVNVEGTLNLLEFAQHEAESHGRPVVFMYPSSIAAYGLPGSAAKAAAGRVREDEWAHPTTMYGCNKLYCEQLGTYYARHYKQLAAESAAGRVDFRCVRFPGLISAVTMPSGGTSDYAPEMIHAAAKGEPYSCFVRPDTRIPFMAMPDAVEALMRLAAAPRRHLTRTAYNVAAFNPSAEEFCRAVRAAFPDSRIEWETDEKRQGILDSWPADVDDSAARRDWGFAPRYDFDRAFNQYLVPTIRTLYSTRAAG
jgi:nucleoside-diphosphate-sugar epimerase